MTVDPTLSGSVVHRQAFELIPLPLGRHTLHHTIAAGAGNEDILAAVMARKATFMQLEQIDQSLSHQVLQTTFNHLVAFCVASYENLAERQSMLIALGEYLDVHEALLSAGVVTLLRDVLKSELGKFENDLIQSRIRLAAGVSNQTKSDSELLDQALERLDKELKTQSTRRKPARVRKPTRKQRNFQKRLILNWQEN